METQNIQQQETAVLPASEADTALVREMMSAGLMYGHKSSKTHPKFKQYVSANRNGIEIIDLFQTISHLNEAADFLNKKVKEGGKVLIVATQPAARNSIEEFAQKFGFSFINDRWVGGLLTNFKIISSRIEYFKKIQSGLGKGEFEKYTKKERIMISRNIERMKKMFTGLENLNKLPDVIFMIDLSIKGHQTAVREAKITNIPIVSILDSDDNPKSIDYPIPANDHSKSSIEWIIKKIEERLTV